MTLWAIIRPHIFWVVLIGIGLICGHSWLAEHDQRMLADAQIKQSQAAIQQLNATNATLQAQIATSDANAQKALSSLKAAAVKVTTPEQAIAAIPDVSALPLRPLILPDGRVSVDALSLYAELNGCQQTKVQLAGCQTARADDELIIQNDNRESLMQKGEIQTLKQKPRFWARVASTAKQVGIGIGIGVLLGARL